MSKRVLAIGVGGSGKAALTILKERLEETYGQVPDNVVLLSLDTDDLRDVDTFAGTRLNPQYDSRRREPEFRHVVSKPGVTMDTIFADIASGKTSSFMYWLEKEKLDRALGPSERDIRGGAQQRRPVGRVALFQRWDNPIYSSITEAIARVYGEPEEEQPVDAIKMEQSKRVIFIIGSVAGGTGSGFLIDVANLVRHAVLSNSKWQSVDVSAIIVLPDAFSAYTTMMNDPTNLKPNSYAALRELDRFIRTHSASLPYMIRYGQDLRSITWSTNQPLDHVYLVDTASPSAIGDRDLKGNPMRGVFPIISDFIMAHVDKSLGDALATLRSNAGQHYGKEEGWQYSSFNVMTYIFPVDDVIESFSYRFLREMVTKQFLPIPTKNKKRRAQVEQRVLKETERVFSENKVQDKVNPGVIQKAIAATRRVEPELPDVSWPGLFNLISLSEGSFAEDYQNLQQWLDYLVANLIPTKEGDYKKESYDDGYVRLLNFSGQFMDDCLGPQYDPDDEEARMGGDWDKILSRYRDALRQRFSEALDAALLDLLNRRDPRSKVLAPHRLPEARVMVAILKDKLLRFKELLEQEYRQFDVDTRIRQTSEELRETIAWMQDTKDSKTWVLIGKPEARKSQDAYIGLFYDKMELLLHQRIFRVVMDVLDALGAADEDQDGNLSVLDQAALELENWQATWVEVDKILARWQRIHNKNRADKKQIRVRRYLTDDEFENQLYQQPEHVGRVAQRVLGQVRGKTGMVWQRVDETEPLNYKLTTMWTEEAKGAEEIANGFFTGAKGLFQMVREHVTVAERVAAEFGSPNSFGNTVRLVDEPFLRYQPATNGKSMFHERYVSFNLEKASDESRKFLEKAKGYLGDQGVNVDSAAESLVACTVVEVARGVRLNAVDQFVACEPDYRGKLYKGHESLHLFPEEQVATDYESRIESLGEPDNRQRPLSPELVITMGDENKLKLFTLACAYGLIEPYSYWDDETGQESTEVYLDLKPGESDDKKHRLRLSYSPIVRELDPRFNDVSAEEQKARLYLNALQNFVLLFTQKPGVAPSMVATLVGDLKNRGVSLDHIENPFTLRIRQVSNAIRQVVVQLGPTEEEYPDRRTREAYNARRRIDKYLRRFLNGQVQAFKKSPSQRIRDMGTVMHLTLDGEINRLAAQAAGAGEK